MINTGVSRGSIASSIPFSVKNIRPNLIEAFWNMDNDPSDDQQDSSGVGPSLIYSETGPSGPYATIVDGKAGAAVSFSAPNTPFMSSGGRYYTDTWGIDCNSPFTLSVWMKTRNFSANSHVIGAPIENGLYISSNGTQQTFTLYDGTPGGLTAPLVTPNTWVHYVLTRSAQWLTLFVNSAGISTADISGRIYPNNGVFSVGGGEFDEYYYDGDIDALGIWSTVLTQQEINALYNNGRGAQYS